MTKTFAALLAFAMLTALPAAAATQVANSSNSAHCSEQAAEGYKRPGGYCEQIDDLNSLVPASDGACATVADAGFRYDEIEGRMLVAIPMDPCCRHDVGSLTGGDLPPVGILVADRCVK